GRGSRGADRVADRRLRSGPAADRHAGSRRLPAAQVRGRTRRGGGADVRPRRSELLAAEELLPHLAQHLLDAATLEIRSRVVRIHLVPRAVDDGPPAPCPPATPRAMHTPCRTSSTTSRASITPSSMPTRM